MSSLVKRAGSFRHIFTSGQRKPMQKVSLSGDSVVEEDIYPPLKVETTENTNELQTPSPHATSHNLSYEAESPDEAALVYAANAYGFTLVARTPDSVTVRLPSGEDLVFEVLDTLAFDSTRKRMSVLVRHPITRECVLYTKGADYAIMELLCKPDAGVGQWKHIHTLSLNFSNALANTVTPWATS